MAQNGSKMSPKLTTNLPFPSAPSSANKNEEIDMFRSTPMTLLQLYIPSEAAQITIAELGQLGILQFRDLNEYLPPHQRNFTPELNKLNEVENKLESLLTAAESCQNVKYAAIPSNTTSTNWTPPSAQELNERESELNQYEERISEMTENVQVLEKKLEELQEYQQVLSTVSLLLHNSSNSASIEPQLEKSSSAQPLTTKERDTFTFNDVESSSNVVTARQFIVGTMSNRKYAAFERVLWRAMRGNVYMRKSDLNSSSRCVFVCFAHGTSALQKIQKICSALGCRIYADVDEDATHRASQLLHVTTQLADLTNILFNTRQARFAEISNIAASLADFRVTVAIQRSILAVMNLMRFDGGRKSLIGEAWCPESLVSQLDESLQRARERAGLDFSSLVTVLKPPATLSPPTLFPTTRFTKVFQDINDAYGIACYREANPGLFMIITFPFLFSLMFGDVGHAIVMLLGALVMVLLERRLAKSAADSEMFSMIFDGRYIILLMGIFSIYAGFIYNDIFSKSVALFTSMFTPPNQASGTCDLFQAGYVYPFGIDPRWNHAANNLNFTNAVKMKLSIVIAILHMNLGICLSAANYLHQRDWQSLCFHFVPQFLFFNCLFGYMAWMIVWKWMTGIDRSILNTFITMMMQFGGVEGGEDLFFFYQVAIQRFLIFIAFLSVPWMIFGRPLYVLWQRKRIEAQGYQEANRSGSVVSVDSTGSKIESTESEEDEGFAGMVIHESIHAIEFVLGSVSNTASYLRLWALSLAHAQLSEVLWSLCLESFMFNPVTLIVGYALWFFATFGLMVAMEGLSAFLHALRLHWVEFNNKFYAGQGVAFEPFSLNLYTGQSIVIPAQQPVKY